MLRFGSAINNSLGKKVGLRNGLLQSLKCGPMVEFNFFNKKHWDLTQERNERKGRNVKKKEKEEKSDNGDEDGNGVEWTVP